MAGSARHPMTPTYSVAEAAERVGRSRRTIYRWITVGLLHPVEGRIREDELVHAEQQMRSSITRTLGGFRHQTACPTCQRPWKKVHA